MNCKKEHTSSNLCWASRRVVFISFMWFSTVLSRPRLASQSPEAKMVRTHSVCISGPQNFRQLARLIAVSLSDSLYLRLAFEPLLLDVEISVEEELWVSEVVSSPELVSSLRLMGRF